MEINNGMQSIPTILFPDGNVLVEPTDAQLEAEIMILIDKKLIQIRN